MPSEEKWIIQKTNGQLLQSFAIDPDEIRVGLVQS